MIEILCCGSTLMRGHASVSTCRVALGATGLNVRQDFRLSESSVAADEKPRSPRGRPGARHETEQRQAANWWDQISRETVRIDSSAGLRAEALLRAQLVRL
jgi:hypothetical protein